MDDKEKLPGILSIAELSDSERDNFIDYMDGARPGLNTEFISVLMGDQMLKFFDVLAGLSIKIPPREEIWKYVSYVKIYTYCKNRGFNDETYENAAKIFKKRKASIVRVIDKVKRTIEKAEESKDIESDS